MSEQVRHDCCFLNYDFKEEVEENVSVEDDDLEEAPDFMCADHDCSHKCEMRNGTATCVCENGFYLATDGRTCMSGIAEPFKNDDCDEGFRKNYDGECEDIDECQEATHSCQESDTCVNNYGSFNCEPEETCDEGFRFSTETKKCEGE